MVLLLQALGSKSLRWVAHTCVMYSVAGEEATGEFRP